MISVHYVWEYDANTCGFLTPACDDHIGIPCVSLTHHLPSLATKLHHGKFRANGGCGFVPKPLVLRSTRAIDEVRYIRRNREIERVRERVQYMCMLSVSFIFLSILILPTYIMYVVNVLYRYRVRCRRRRRRRRRMFSLCM